MVAACGSGRCDSMPMRISHSPSYNGPRATAIRRRNSGPGTRRSPRLAIPDKRRRRAEGANSRTVGSDCRARLSVLDRKSSHKRAGILVPQHLALSEGPTSNTYCHDRPSVGDFARGWNPRTVLISRVLLTRSKRRLARSGGWLPLLGDCPPLCKKALAPTRPTQPCFRLPHDSRRPARRSPNQNP